MLEFNTPKTLILEKGMTKREQKSDGKRLQFRHLSSLKSRLTINEAVTWCKTRRN